MQRGRCAARLAGKGKRVLLVLHTHWNGGDHPRLLLWAEDSSAPRPPARKRSAATPRARAHPFCATPARLQAVLEGTTGLGKGKAELTLPSGRFGPLPSPDLVHDWDLAEAEPPRLAEWVVSGLMVPPADVPELLSSRLAPASLPPGVVLGADARFWRLVSGLALEALAKQELVPDLTVDGDGTKALARWRPVLDSPMDASRLSRLAQAMPPVCRAAHQPGQEPPASSALLKSFLDEVVDALARRWASSAALQIAERQDPVQQWLGGLFSDDGRVRASRAQLQALAHSHKAWLRNLRLAGDASYRVALRLEAPLQRAAAQDQAGLHAGGQGDEWHLHYLLQAADDPSLLLPAELIWKGGGTVLEHVGHRFDRPQERLLAGLGYAARLCPPIAASLKARHPVAARLDSQGAYTFMRETAPLLEGAGFGLLVPPWWGKPGARLGVRLRLHASPDRVRSKSGDGSVSPGQLSYRSLVGFEWQVAVGDTTLSHEEFQSLVALKSPLVQIRGQWVQLDPEQVEAAVQFWQKQQAAGEMELPEALRLALGGEVATLADGGQLPIDSVEAEGWLGEVLRGLSASEAMEQLPQPAGLQGQLRPYQRYGFSWMHFLRRFGLGACLADDMGLGKTIETIALLLHEKERQGSLPAPALLVCPTSVVTNWQREVQRFAPALKTLVHQGSSRLRGEEFAHAATTSDIVLTSFATLRQDAPMLLRLPWYAVIVDEAQNIKNAGTQQARAVRALPAAFRIALTGTPVENRLSELWSIMSFLNPGYLGSQDSFRKSFAIPIERYGDENAARRLKQLIGSLVLRRVKTDPTVIQDLPEKQESKVYCNLTEEQATLYEAVVKTSLERVETSEGIERRGLVLSLLMQLKQICNHPAQYLHQGEAAAREPRPLASRSGKLARLTDMLEEVVAEGDRALVFTQFAEMGQLLRDYLPGALGCPALFLHGGTPAAKRDEMVARFQGDDGGPMVFVLSLKAGGTGLNLTRASRVFHFDRWWNPAVEDQATDRAFRIGQRRNVQVYKFVTTGTVEEMVDEMIESKRGLARAIIGTGEQWLTELSTDALRDLVRLRRNAVEE